MGVALLGIPDGKKNVFTRKSIIYTFGKVCAKFHEYLEICRYQTKNVHKWLDYLAKVGVSIFKRRLEMENDIDDNCSAFYSTWFVI